MERFLNCSMVDAPACCSGRVDANLRPHRRDHFVRSPRPSCLPVSRHNTKCFEGRCSKLVLRSSTESKSNGVHSKQDEDFPENNKLVWTKFVAETLLPTSYGKLRLRGYRHTVRLRVVTIVYLACALDHTTIVKLLWAFICRLTAA